LATDPRHVPSGTSYEASGDLGTPQLDRELGSAMTAPLREIVPELASARQRILTYNKMVDSDGAIQSSLTAAKGFILGGEFYIDAPTNQPADVDMAEQISDNLFNTMSAPFPLVLEDVLTMFEYGNQPFEICWTSGEWAPKRSGANRKKYTLLKKLLPLPGLRYRSTLTTITVVLQDSFRMRLERTSRFKRRLSTLRSFSSLRSVGAVET
jgi:hypothetical protein